MNFMIRSKHFIWGKIVVNKYICGIPPITSLIIKLLFITNEVYNLHKIESIKFIKSIKIESQKKKKKSTEMDMDVSVLKY